MLVKARTPDNRGITPEKAKRILRENGVEVNEKEVEEILEFLYLLAKLAVNQYISDKGIKHV